MENLWSMKGTKDKFTWWVTDGKKMSVAYKTDREYLKYTGALCKLTRKRHQI